MEKNRLYRTKKDRMIAGVCSGLADYFDIDPVIVRVLFVILTIGPGIGLIGYIILWIVVPEAPYRFVNGPDYTEQQTNQADTEANYTEFTTYGKHKVPTSQKIQGRVLIASILILVGLFWFLDNIFTFVSFAKLWPLILIAVGIIILLRPRNTERI